MYKFNVLFPEKFLDSHINLILKLYYHLYHLFLNCTHTEVHCSSLGEIKINWQLHIKSVLQFPLNPIFEYPDSRIPLTLCSFLLQDLYFHWLCIICFPFCIWQMHCIHRHCKFRCLSTKIKCVVFMFSFVGLDPKIAWMVLIGTTKLWSFFKQQ